MSHQMHRVTSGWSDCNVPVRLLTSRCSGKFEQETKHKTQEATLSLESRDWLAAVTCLWDWWYRTALANFNMQQSTSTQEAALSLELRDSDWQPSCAPSNKVQHKNNSTTSWEDRFRLWQQSRASKSADITLLWQTLTRNNVSTTQEQPHYQLRGQI